MSQRNFIITVILVNVTFVLLQIDKRMRSTRLIYRKQALEQELANLTKRHDQLQQELCCLQQHDTVKRYAARYLHMRPITLRQLKKISDHA
jgi:cell division protein FtsL